MLYRLSTPRLNGIRTHNINGERQIQLSYDHDHDSPFTSFVLYIYL
jgi:hypothetical protein